MRLTGSLVLILLLTASLSAQDRPGREARVSGTGTITKLAPGVLEVESSEGDKWIVAITPRAEVSVSGTASPEFLRPGMLVKLSGTFNRKGEAVEPLKTLTVFTPRPQPRQPQRPEEPVNPELNAIAKGLFQSNEPAPPPKKERPMRPVRTKPPEEVDVSTAGTLAGARGGKLQVRTPGGVLKFELTEDAEVSLDINDYSVARPGDRVNLEGWYYQGDKTKVVANRLRITLSEPLGVAKDEKSDEDAKEGEGKDEAKSDEKSSEKNDE